MNDLGLLEVFPNAWVKASSISGVVVHCAGPPTKDEGTRPHVIRVTTADGFTQNSDAMPYTEAVERCEKIIEAIGGTKFP